MIMKKCEYSAIFTNAVDLARKIDSLSGEWAWRLAIVNGIYKGEKAVLLTWIEIYEDDEEVQECEE